MLSWRPFSFGILSIPLRTTRNSSQDEDLTQAKSRKGCFARAMRSRAGEYGDPFGGHRRPGLLASEVSDAAGNSGAAVDVGDVRESLPKFFAKQRKVRAGEHDCVDTIALRSVEHRLRSCLDFLDADVLASKLGLGELDQLRRAMANDG